MCHNRRCGLKFGEEVRFPELIGEHGRVRLVRLEGDGQKRLMITCSWHGRLGTSRERAFVFPACFSHVISFQRIVIVFPILKKNSCDNSCPLPELTNVSGYLAHQVCPPPPLSLGEVFAPPLSPHTTVHAAGTTWGELVEGRVPQVVEEEEDPCQPRFGWQQKASSAIEKHHFQVSVWPQLLEHERAMMRSQIGPLASAPFVSFPVDRTSRIRRTFPSALASQASSAPRCGRLLVAKGHHRAVFATVGVLGRRGWALESVAARVCREGGARVRAKVCVTWIWQSTAGWTAGLWQTVSLSLVVSSLPHSAALEPRTCRRRWQGPVDRVGS